MARPLRIEYPGAVYHVMNRGLSRQTVFRKDDDYEGFQQILAESHDLWGVEVFAYCLMSNHYHLCLRTPEGNLSRVMRHINGVYTQRFNRRYRRDGPLFRGRYKAIVLEAETYLAAVIRYVHLNSVKAKLVKSPEAYTWCSHAHYLKPRLAPSWLSVGELLHEYASPRAFHQFVTLGNEDEIENFFSAGKRSPVLGSNRFRVKIGKQVRALSREHPRYERVMGRPTVQQVLRVVAKVFGTHVSFLLQGRRGVNNDARKVAMYLVKRLCDLTLQETATQFGVTSYGVVGWAGAQVRTKLSQDSRFRKQVSLVEDIIQPEFVES